MSRTVIRKDSMIIPMKYLDNRFSIDLMALFMFSSYLSGTRAFIIFSRRLPSCKKKKAMNITENKPTAKFMKNDAIDEKALENEAILTNCFNWSIATTSILKSGPTVGNVLMMVLLKLCRGPEIF